MDFLSDYAQALLLAANFMVVWEFSSAKLKLASILKWDIYSHEDFDSEIILKWKFWGELLTCPICYSTWTSAIFAAGINFDLQFIIFSAFSLPSFVYFLYFFLTRVQKSGQ